jgi:uncharacterized membrane protein YeaQ/YmgE (transglycosylase-associated protein family)
MLNIIWAIIAGLIIGLLAKFVVPGRQAIPIWLTILLGIVGALIGNWLAALFGSVSPAGSIGSATSCGSGRRPC